MSTKRHRSFKETLSALFTSTNTSYDEKSSKQSRLPSKRFDSSQIHFPSYEVSSSLTGCELSSNPSQASICQFLRETYKLAALDRQINSRNRQRKYQLSRALCSVIRSYALDDVRMIWKMVSNLIYHTKLRESQLLGFELMYAMIEGQGLRLESLRGEIIQTVQQNPRHNVAHKLYAVTLLSRDKAFLVQFADQIALLLVDWIEVLGPRYNVISPTKSSSKNHAASLSVSSPSNHQRQRQRQPPVSVRSLYATFYKLSSSTSPYAMCSVAKYLDLSPAMNDVTSGIVQVLSSKLFIYIINLISFNGQHLSQQVLVTLTSAMCDQCIHCPDPMDEFVTKYCLPFLDELVRVNFPPDCYDPVIFCLCACVNIASRDSWQVMKAALNGPAGADIMHQLLSLMDDLVTLQQQQPNHLTARALRGAVFFVGMACWGSQRVEALQFPFSVVLSRLVRITRLGDPTIIFEVLLSTRRLVKKYRQHLRAEWDSLLEVLNLSRDVVIQNWESTGEVVCAILVMITSLYDKGLLFLNHNDLIKLLRLYRGVLPDESKQTLLNILSKLIHPANHDWLDHLRDLLHTFFVKESQPETQLEALQIFENKLWSYRGLYCDEIIEYGLFPALVPGIAGDVDVRKCVFKLLGRIATDVRTSHFKTILSIIYNGTAVDVCLTDPCINRHRHQQHPHAPRHHYHHHHHRDQKGTKGSNRPGHFSNAIVPVIPEVRQVREVACRVLIEVLKKTISQPPFRNFVAVFEMLIELLYHSDVQIRLYALETLLGIGALHNCHITLTLGHDFRAVSPFLFSSKMWAPVHVRGNIVDYDGIKGEETRFPHLANQSSGILPVHLLLEALLDRLGTETRQDCFRVLLRGLDACLDRFYLFCDVSPQRLVATICQLLQNDIERFKRIYHVSTGSNSRGSRRNRNHRSSSPSDPHQTPACVDNLTIEDRQIMLAILARVLGFSNLLEPAEHAAIVATFAEEITAYAETSFLARYSPPKKQRQSDLHTKDTKVAPNSPSIIRFPDASAASSLSSSQSSNFGIKSKHKTSGAQAILIERRLPLYQSCLLGLTVSIAEIPQTIAKTLDNVVKSLAAICEYARMRNATEWIVLTLQFLDNLASYKPGAHTLSASASLPSSSFTIPDSLNAQASARNSPNNAPPASPVTTISGADIKNTPNSNILSSTSNHSALFSPTISSTFTPVNSRTTTPNASSKTMINPASNHSVTLNNSMSRSNSSKFPFQLNESLTLALLSAILPQTNTAVCPPHILQFAHHTLASWFFRFDDSHSEYISLIKATLLSNLHIHKCPYAATLLDLIGRFKHFQGQNKKSLNYHAPSDKDDAAGIFGSDCATQTWVQGLTLITIKTGILGYSQLVIRRATGTVSWVMKLQNRVAGQNTLLSLQLPIASLAQVDVFNPHSLSAQYDPYQCPYHHTDMYSELYTDNSTTLPSASYTNCSFAPSLPSTVQSQPSSQRSSSILGYLNRNGPTSYGSQNIPSQAQKSLFHHQHPHHSQPSNRFVPGHPNRHPHLRHPTHGLPHPHSKSTSISRQPKPFRMSTYPSADSINEVASISASYSPLLVTENEVPSSPSAVPLSGSYPPSPAKRLSPFTRNRRGSMSSIGSISPLQNDNWHPDLPVGVSHQPNFLKARQQLNFDDPVRPESLPASRSLSSGAERLVDQSSARTRLMGRQRGQDHDLGGMLQELIHTEPKEHQTRPKEFNVDHGNNPEKLDQGSALVQQLKQNITSIGTSDDPNSSAVNDKPIKVNSLLDFESREEQSDDNSFENHFSNTNDKSEDTLYRLSPLVTGSEVGGSDVISPLGDETALFEFSPFFHGSALRNDSRAGSPFGSPFELDSSQLELKNDPFALFHAGTSPPLRKNSLGTLTSSPTSIQTNSIGMASNVIMTPSPDGDNRNQNFQKDTSNFGADNTETVDDNGQSSGGHASSMNNSQSNHVQLAFPLPSTSGIKQDQCGVAKTPSPDSVLDRSSTTRPSSGIHPLPVTPFPTPISSKESSSKPTTGAQSITVGNLLGLVNTPSPELEQTKMKQRIADSGASTTDLAQAHAQVSDDIPTTKVNGPAQKAASSLLHENLLRIESENDEQYQQHRHKDQSPNVDRKHSQRPPANPFHLKFSVSSHDQTKPESSTNGSDPKALKITDLQNSKVTVPSKAGLETPFNSPLPQGVNTSSIRSPSPPPASSPAYLEWLTSGEKKNEQTSSQDQPFINDEDIKAMLIAEPLLTPSFICSQFVDSAIAENPSIARHLQMQPLKDKKQESPKLNINKDDTGHVDHSSNDVSTRNYHGTNSKDGDISRGLHILDSTPAKETVKIGILYAGSNQSTELEFLSNSFGSARYDQFLSSLGQIIPLQGCNIYTGGLDRLNNLDGKFGLFSSSSLREVCFHVSTLIPALPARYKHYHNKTRHLGNNRVLIVYAEPDSNYHPASLVNMSHIDMFHIIVQPLFSRTNLYRVRTVRVTHTNVVKQPNNPTNKPMCKVSLQSSLILSEKGLAWFVLQTAFQANMRPPRARVGEKANQPSHVHTCLDNWQQRLKVIQRMKKRLTA